MGDYSFWKWQQCQITKVDEDGTGTGMAYNVRWLSANSTKESGPQWINGKKSVPASNLRSFGYGSRQKQAIDNKNRIRRRRKEECRFCKTCLECIMCCCGQSGSGDGN